MMWYWGGGVHWWGWLLGTIGMVAFCGLVFWATWYFVTAVTRRPEDRPQANSDPKRILDERLARGEIDSGEYRHLREVLRGGDATPSGRKEPTATGDRR